MPGSKDRFPFKPRALLSALAAVSPSAVFLALKSPSKARYLLSVTIREVAELRETGLHVREVIRTLCERSEISHTSLRLPIPFFDEGGTTAQELAVLAGVVAVTSPQRVFEIGTFFGLATTTFALNAPSSAEIITLDLPPEGGSVEHYLPSDADLVTRRRVGEWYRVHGLSGQVSQLFVDSLHFDPAPYRDSVDIGFIDGAHTREYVINDTRKMVTMMREGGILLWHDYGGRGTFAGITDHLESLSRRVPIYREPNTSLAWAEAGPLKALFAREETSISSPVG